MARDFDGSSNFIENASEILTPPLSISGAVDIADVTTNGTVLAITNSTGIAIILLQYQGINASNGWRAYLASNSGSTSAVYAGGRASSAKWSYGACSWGSKSGGTWPVPTLYVDGSRKTANPSANAGGAETRNNTSIGGFRYNSSLYYHPHSIGEVGLWNAELTHAELRQLSDGVCPLLIRPGSLFGYWPLGGQYGQHDFDLISRNDMSAVGSPGWTEHITLNDLNDKPFIYPQGVMATTGTATAAATNVGRRILTGSKLDRFGLVQ